jgi:hypothetical protein
VLFLQIIQNVEKTRVNIGIVKKGEFTTLRKFQYKNPNFSALKLRN